MERLVDLILTESGRLDRILAKLTGLSRALVSENILRGSLKLNGVIVTKQSHPVEEGDRIEGTLMDSQPSEILPVAFPLSILHEDADILVINKAQGTVVHPAKSHRGDTLVHYILGHLERHSEFKLLKGERPGIIHRLDKGTSGVIVIAKNRHALEFVSRQFKDRSIQKTYECIVWGNMAESGSFSHSIGRSSVDPRRMSLKARRARTALTYWTRLRAFRHFSHLEVIPKTGRTHQIRVHLSEGGNPIVGDPLYSRERIQKRISAGPEILQFIDSTCNTFLHARSLRLLHPTSGETLTISAPRPSLFDKALDLLDSFDA